MISLYSLLLYLHLLGFLGWAGPTTGAYYLLVLSGEWSSNSLRAYRRLFYVEVLSISLSAVTGGSMWVMLGMPSWGYLAFLTAPPLAVMELYHFWLTGEVERFRNGMRLLSLLYSAILIILLYIMVFKP